MVLEVEYVSAVWCLVSMLQCSGTVIWPFVLLGTSSSTEQHFPHFCFKCKHSFLGLLLILETKDFTHLKSPERPGFICCLHGGVKGKEKPWLPNCFRFYKFQFVTNDKQDFQQGAQSWSLMCNYCFGLKQIFSECLQLNPKNGVTWVNRNQRRLKGLQIKKA